MARYVGRISCMTPSSMSIRLDRRKTFQCSLGLWNNVSNTIGVGDVVEIEDRGNGQVKNIVVKERVYENGN